MLGHAPTAEPAWRRVRVAAEVFGLAEYTIRDWIKSGRIHGRRLGRMLYVDTTEIEAMMVPVPSPRDGLRSK